MNTQTTESAPASHPFTRAGLGSAPFKFVGVEVQDLCYGQAILNRAEYEKSGIALTTKPGGSCAYCGTYIVQMFNVKSADGKTFHVGSDCVAKVAPESPNLAAVVARKVSQIQKLKTASRAAAKISAAAAALTRSEVCVSLQTVSHPNAFRASNGDTLLTYVEFLMAHAGTVGKLRAAKLIWEHTPENDEPEIVESAPSITSYDERD